MDTDGRGYWEYEWHYSDLEEWAQRFVDDNSENPEDYWLWISYEYGTTPAQYPSLVLSLVFDCLVESGSSSDQGVDIRTWLYLMPPAPSEWTWTSTGPDITRIEWRYGEWVGIYGYGREWRFDPPNCWDPHAVELTSNDVHAFRAPPSHFAPWDLDVTSLVGNDRDLDPSQVRLVYVDDHASGSSGGESGWVLLYDNSYTLTNPKGYSWSSALSWSNEDLVAGWLVSNIDAFAVRVSATPTEPVLAAVDEFRWLCSPGQVSADVKSAALRTVYEGMVRCGCGPSGSAGSSSGSGTDMCPAASVVRAEVDELASGR
jgi:hypothetical protein